MAQREYSDYQKDVISNYYKKINTIMLHKLSELVSELYTVDSQAKADKLWQRVHKAMVKLGIPEAIMNHIMEKKDVQVLARNLQEWHYIDSSRKYRGADSRRDRDRSAKIIGNYCARKKFGSSGSRRRSHHQSHPGSRR
ncbi:MAG: hypothetical protein P8016_11510 [Sedimentisphaerales bacterium]